MGLFSWLFGKKNNEVLKNIINNNAFLIDVRTEAEYASGSVKGAINIPVNKIQNQIAKFKNKNNIVVFCKSGNRSAMAKSILQRNGITTVTNGGTWRNVAFLKN